MKKILPVFFLLILFVSFLSFSRSVFAQTLNANNSSSVPDNVWQIDPEVTFVGKAGARAAEFLDWALKHYEWIWIAQGQVNNLTSFWIIIRNVVYAFLLLFVLITAFVIIITQGRNITIRRFLPRFVAMVVLITFSFALIQFIYQIADIIQQFFLRKPDSGGGFISQSDLLSIGFNYKEFIGYRLTGFANDESAFISLLLIKLTTVTYYIMVGVLLIRKVILWLFIIISPIFPLLLLYSPIRNTAKIWIGEFFRWVLYAPLFALFLGGLVSVWRSSTGVPLSFNNFQGVGTNIVYPTAINILLGGPGQQLSITNSLNLTETFALYVVALLMLWGVIVLPFILLKIFLDYFHAYSFGGNPFAKQLLSLSTGLFKGGSPPISPSPVSPSPYQSTGKARAIPFTHTVNMPTSVSNASSFARSSMTSQTYSQPIQRVNVQNTEILKMANLNVPTLHDIARYDTSFTSSKILEHQEVSRIHETLERISNPTMVASPMDRQKYTQIKESLQVEKQKGNPIAAGVLSAAQITSKSTTFQSSEVVEKVTTTQFKEFLQKIENPSTEEYTTLKNQLVSESQKGDNIATSILTAASSTSQQDETTITKLKGEIVAAKDKGSAPSVVKQLAKASGQQTAQVSAVSTLPAVNKVQTVSFDDYESVKKLWQENYEKQDVPKGVNGEDRTREEWVKTDMGKITNTINLLSVNDPQKVKEGMKSVSHILPFLLIGGFSQTEVIAYLKAKEEAAKTVLETSKKKQEEEDTLVTDQKKEETAQKEMHESAEIKEEKPHV